MGFSVKNVNSISRPGKLLILKWDPVVFLPNGKYLAKGSEACDPDATSGQLGGRAAHST